MTNDRKNGFVRDIGNSFNFSSFFGVSSLLVEDDIDAAVKNLDHRCHRNGVDEARRGSDILPVSSSLL